MERLYEFRAKAKTSKNDRINYEKIMAYIDFLARNGTKIGEPYVKQIDKELWELRPLKNRIFFFYKKENKYVLLHHFVKKTPKKEIEKARQNMKDFLKRS